MLIDHVNALRNIMRDVKVKLPFTIDAMVVLPNHWHAVWTLPPDDLAYSQRTRLIKAGFFKHLLREGAPIEKDAGGEYKLWQKRFWEHTIRDNRDFETHVNYGHINPVKHGHVVRATDWPHSTIHRYIERGFLTTNWACDAPEGEFGDS